MAVVEVSIIPVGTPSASLSEFVAGCLEILKNTPGVTYQLNPMGTVIEGDMDHVLEVISRMHEHPFTKGVGRVVTTIRIDDRRDKTLTMAGKIAAVEARLARQG
ncbi:MAG: MTH1187 family thiamine-binding protein [Desulfotomaculaceae bacterium]|nr:MTH1187 family thiamine-binding protein [Desulfotomaculaceae bacterium]